MLLQYVDRSRRWEIHDILSSEMSRYLPAKDPKKGAFYCLDFDGDTRFKYYRTESGRTIEIPIYGRASRARILARYGSYINDKSRDKDFVEIDHGTLEQIVAAGKQDRNVLICSPNQDPEKIRMADIIRHDRARSDAQLRSFAYYNLREDYGIDVADAYAASTGNIVPMEVFLDTNVKVQVARFEEFPHPFRFSKAIFAIMQRRAFEETREFINRKTELEKYVHSLGVDVLNELVRVLWWGTDDTRSEERSEVVPGVIFTELVSSLNDLEDNDERWALEEEVKIKSTINLVHLPDFIRYCFKEQEYEAVYEVLIEVAVSSGSVDPAFYEAVRHALDIGYDIREHEKDRFVITWWGGL